MLLFICAGQRKYCCKNKWWANAVKCNGITRDQCSGKQHFIVQNFKTMTFNKVKKSAFCWLSKNIYTVAFHRVFDSNWCYVLFNSCPDNPTPHLTKIGSIFLYSNYNRNIPFSLHPDPGHLPHCICPAPWAFVQETFIYPWAAGGWGCEGWNWIWQYLSDIKPSHKIPHASVYLPFLYQLWYSMW